MVLMLSYERQNINNIPNLYAIITFKFFNTKAHTQNKQKQTTTEYAYLK